MDIHEIDTWLDEIETGLDALKSVLIAVPGPMCRDLLRLLSHEQTQERLAEIVRRCRSITYSADQLCLVNTIRTTAHRLDANFDLYIGYLQQFYPIQSQTSAYRDVVGSLRHIVKVLHDDTRRLRSLLQTYQTGSDEE